MSKVKSVILSVIGPAILSKARIISNQPIGTRFRLLTFQSDSLKGQTWQPGAKVQIDTGGWVLRTYTPLSINSQKGEMAILVFLPGIGPATVWAQSTKPGDATSFKGPDRSMKIQSSASRIVLFGDETSIGLAAGIQQSVGNRVPVDLFFEVKEPEATRIALEKFAIAKAQFFPTTNVADVHASVSQAMLQKKSEGQTQIILSGSAQSIQKIRANLKTAGVDASQMATKVYWSQGRSGLD